jgi:hypothetical protein
MEKFSSLDSVCKTLKMILFGIVTKTRRAWFLIINGFAKEQLAVNEGEILIVPTPTTYKR